MPILFVSGVFGQGLSESKANIDSTNFYIFSEAGGQYIPSIVFNDFTASGNLTISEPGFEYSYSGTAKYSNLIMSPSLGYNFVLGFGYQINSNLGIELEVGYSQNSLGNMSYTVNTSGSGAGTVLGLPFSGTTSGSGTGSVSGSGSLTYIPVLINLSIQEKSSTFQPLASVGFGACPTILKINNANLSYSESGTISAEAGGIPFNGTYSGVMSAFGDVGSQTTAIPFAFKLKAGFDYKLNRHASLGLRAWAMGLANSNFGEGLESDLYGAVGLNASLKVEF
jgi:hypothetical protein